MEIGEMDEESFVRFVERSGNEFELEHLASEPSEPSWCAGTSAGTGWYLVEDSQTLLRRSRLVHCLLQKSDVFISCLILVTTFGIACSRELL